MSRLLPRPIRFGSLTSSAYLHRISVHAGFERFGEFHGGGKQKAPRAVRLARLREFWSERGRYGEKFCGLSPYRLSRHHSELNSRRYAYYYTQSFGVCNYFLLDIGFKKNAAVVHAALRELKPAFDDAADHMRDHVTELLKEHGHARTVRALEV